MFVPDRSRVEALPQFSGAVVQRLHPKAASGMPGPLRMKCVRVRN